MDISQLHACQQISKLALAEAFLTMNRPIQEVPVRKL
jgi:hypothetical protein